MKDKKESQETETTERLLPKEEATEEFIGEKADWSEDISELKKNRKKQ